MWQLVVKFKLLFRCSDNREILVGGGDKFGDVPDGGTVGFFWAKFLF